MGLPHHPASVSHFPSVTLNAHCETILRAAVHRPTVSDTLDAIRTQCDLYERMYQNVSSESTVFHQQPLVDSAFIVYDMRKSLCRQFIGDLTCSWLDEIHCYSDRDQVSFPSVLASSGVHLSPNTTSSVPEMHHRVFVNTVNIPMVHISKRSCHWYYRSFGRCVATRGSVVPSHQLVQRTQTASPRVAIIVAGVFQRFLFKSTVQKLIGALTRRNIVVDFYLSLTTAQSYQSDNSYVRFLQPDSFLPTNFSDFVIIEEFIRAKVSSVHASVGEVVIQPTVDIDSEPLLQAKRARAQVDRPNEDPDFRFPLFDLRNKELSGGQHVANANRNFLRKHLGIQNLWRSVTNWENEDSSRYDYVIFLRHDTHWFSEFSLDPFFSSPAKVLVPACDAGNPPMGYSELSDHLIISRREAADIIGNYYSALFNIDLQSCMHKLPQYITAEGSRGCSKEMLFKYIMDSNGIEVERVGQNLVPFQLSAYVKLSDGSSQQCISRFCQSRENSLNVPSQLQRCQDLIWEAAD